MGSDDSMADKKFQRIQTLGIRESRLELSPPGRVLEILSTMPDISFALLGHGSEDGPRITVALPIDSWFSFELLGMQPWLV